MVGRLQEKTKLWDMYDQLKFNDKPGIAVIVGSAGTGKRYPIIACLQSYRNFCYQWTQFDFSLDSTLVSELIWKVWKEAWIVKGKCSGK